MNYKQRNQLPLGLYRVHWKGGGVSLAAVGQMHDGERWLACSNWTSESGKHSPVAYDQDMWDRVKHVELIRSVQEETVGRGRE